MEKVNLTEKFALFSDYWSPKIVGELNGQQVKLAKFHGDFVWHHHENEDELFFVIKGQLKILFRELKNQSFHYRTAVINPGEFIIVPRGVEHKPVADQEVHVMLLEPASTLNTGNATNSEKTVEILQRL